MIFLLLAVPFQWLDHWRGCEGIAAAQQLYQLSLGNPAPSHARYYKTCGKGVWAMALQAFVQISGMLETNYDANYDVKLVVRVRRLVRAYTLVKV